MPMVVLVGAFLLIPAVVTVYLSFTKWDGIGAPSFVFVANYRQILADPAFLASMANTLAWVIGVLVLHVGLGLALALLINGAFFAEPLKRAIYLPAAISGTAVAVIWYFVFDPTVGLLNESLRAVGLGDLARPWLLSPPLNTIAMIGAATWQGLGPTMVLFLVGLQAIPRDVLEASMVDGASGWTMFRRITIPLLRPTTVVVVAIALIGSLKIFDIVWVMTKGGPYRSSETLAVMMYRETFVLGKFGYGAAVAVLLTLIVFIVTIIYLRAAFRRSGDFE